MTRYDLAGRVAIVTGGLGGIGRAIARTFLAGGAAVSLWDRAAGERAPDDLAALGDVAARQVDVTDPASVAAALRRDLDAFGHVDALVNNAGILGPVAPSWETPVDAFRRVLDVNLTGAFICAGAVVPAMLARPARDVGGAPYRGAIVNVASIQGKEGMARASAYSASKAGLMALTKTLGKELATDGIMVNAVAPAAAETAMAQQITPERRADILSRIPVGRFVTVEEIAAAVAWLCSPDCSFTTGTVLDLSGGRATY
ncbi:MAG: SDR family oxidoreductase [Alphaproteobacteria bacterium]|nr:SDR family oxidoreductase [Alphaproteobacteria bacterium]